MCVCVDFILHRCANGQKSLQSVLKIKSIKYAPELVWEKRRNNYTNNYIWFGNVNGIFVSIYYVCVVLAHSKSVYVYSDGLKKKHVFLNSGVFPDKSVQFVCIY